MWYLWAKYSYLGGVGWELVLDWSYIYVRHSLTIYPKADGYYLNFLTDKFDMMTTTTVYVISIDLSYKSVASMCSV